MILENRRLAYRMAHRYEGHGLDREDLEQEAVAGLIEAVDRFDPGRGTAFSAYAMYWIRRSLQQAILRGGCLIRTPAPSGRGPARPRPRLVSLDTPTTPDSTLTVADTIADPFSLDHDPIHTLTRALARERLYQLLDLLPPRERRVVDARFGFNGTGQPETLKHIGERMGLTHERVRQILDQALRRLRHGARLVRLQELTDDIDIL